MSLAVGIAALVVTVRAWRWQRVDTAGIATGPDGGFITATLGRWRSATLLEERPTKAWIGESPGHP